MATNESSTTWRTTGMGTTRFDELTKTLASATSRRSMLKSIAIVATGGVVALFGARSAEAQHKKKAHCGHEGEACGGNTGVSCCGSLVCAGPIGQIGTCSRGKKK